MNYSINEDLLHLECFKELHRGHKTSALVILSFVLHWTRIAKASKAIVPIKQLANTWSVKPATMSQAAQMLVDCGLIKCIKPWQRVGGKPGEYVVLDKSACIPEVTTLYTRGHKPVAFRTTVNNYNNNYKKNDSYDKESSSLVPGSIEWVEMMELKQKQEGK